MADQKLTTAPGAVVPAEAIAYLIAELERPSPLGGDHISIVAQHESARMLGRKQAADCLRALLVEYDAVMPAEDADERD